ncbi:MAG: GIY-YIG nuclease family protein [Patescibacteria group bacterium]
MNNLQKIRQQLTKLPDFPGIYLFYNEKKELIYVGKATSLKNRVKSYFNSRLRNKSGVTVRRPIESLVHEIAKIDYRTTESVFEAIILEAIYIKKFLPKYNVLGKDDKSWNYLVITNEEFPTVKTIREHDLQNLEKKIELKKKFKNIFGPFPGLNSSMTLKILRRLFFYRTCEPKSGKPCFYRQINQCLGVCSSEITAKNYIKKSINPLILFLNGNKKKVIQNFAREMNRLSKNESFEEAGRLRNQIFQLQKIQDFALLNKTFFENEKFSENKIKTIEGYDISNFGNNGLVGSMVKFFNGQPDKKNYRKFKIKTVKKQSDVDCLKEVLTRRLKNDWPLPDLFLIDGGLPQINATKTILKNFKIKIPIVSIAKGPTRKNENFFTNDATILHWLKENKTLSSDRAKLLLSVRDEAHRFAINFQRQTRKIK